MTEVSFEAIDDLESLLKTCLWCLDFDCHTIISQVVKQQQNVVTPKQVLRVWKKEIWVTPIGKMFKSEIDILRTTLETNPNYDIHNHVASCLDKLGWTQSWYV